MKTYTLRFLQRNAVCLMAGILILVTGLSALAHATKLYKSPVSTIKAISFAGGNGTEGSPYQIGTVDQLQAMKDYLDKHFILVADIDASATATWNESAGFDPVGATTANKFTGSLKGNGYQIINLKINRPSLTGVGLFGYSSGKIIGVKLENVDITGNFSVGSLAGENSGMIENSSATGKVEGKVAQVGGLVGGNPLGTINTSYTAVAVKGGSTNVGGLVGHSSTGNINNCYAIGSVEGNISVGGLLG